MSVSLSLNVALWGPRSYYDLYQKIVNVMSSQWSQSCWIWGSCDSDYLLGYDDVFIDISEKYAAFIFRIEEQAEWASRLFAGIAEYCLQNLKEIDCFRDTATNGTIY